MVKREGFRIGEEKVSLIRVNLERRLEYYLDEIKYIFFYFWIF